MTFAGRVFPLSATRRAEMSGRSHHAGLGCPGWDALCEVEVTHWGFRGEALQGTLIVAAQLGSEVVSIFEAIYESGFRIERMFPIDVYDGDDDASMAANYSSAFNCRCKTGSTTELSAHGLGRAIDINPVQNPY